MPHNEREIAESGVPISFKRKNHVTVRTSKFGGTSFNEPRIPIDSRIYICAGQIHFKDGTVMRANFEIIPTNKPILDESTVKVNIDQDWYWLDEQELYEKLDKIRNNLFPFKWTSDRPLDLELRGPYDVNFQL
ncbi:MAG: hypothetical protein RLQ12_04565 [Cyclobacteriaceae bacterium]